MLLIYNDLRKLTLIHILENRILFYKEILKIDAGSSSMLLNP